MTPQSPDLEAGTVLRLVSADPDVAVTEDPPPPAPPVGPSPPAGSVYRVPAVPRTFRVRLAPRARAGRLRGALRLVLCRAGDPPGEGPVVNTVPWRGTSTP